jgi:hypothetical protein
MLYVCGSSQPVHFEPLIVTNLNALWTNAVLCFYDITVVVARAEFLNDQASFLGVVEA